MMKKTRPNSVSVLPSHTQFKDKPLVGGPDSAVSPAIGRWTLRKVILGAGGLLFVYITLTTVFGSGPEHTRRGPLQSRPETDPYSESVPKGDNAPGRGHYDNSYDNDRNNNNKQVPEQIHLDPIEDAKKNNNDGLKDEEMQKEVVVDDTEEEEAEQQPQSGSNSSNNKGDPAVDDEGDVVDSDEGSTAVPLTEETPLEKATRARLASPATYPQLLSANRRERDYAVALIVKEADLALKSTDVYSVVLKDQTAPSNDIHDYLSLSKYYWPSLDKPGGLPYYRKDGSVNPEIETVKDYRLLRTMIREVHMMGMAYHFTGDSSYSKKCAYRLREWFLDEATYMNPNINYGSLQKGKKFGVRTGVLDLFTIYRVFDALHYLKQDPSWPTDLIPSLQDWFKKYVQWLDTSILAKQERNGNNNHGTYYDVQVIGIYLFLGRVEDARAVAQAALKTRIDDQIKSDGRQPEELARKTSWYYSVFNLQALMSLARWGDDVGVDMWNYEGPEGQSIKKAVDFLLPYSLKNGDGWLLLKKGDGKPVENIKGYEMADYLKCLQIAYAIWGDEKYMDAITYLEPKIRARMVAGELKTISTYMCDMSTLFEGGHRGGQGMIWHWCLT
ncbi:hypothetical protein BGZ83_010676 [Gryganskiella cystojenkinii]|nr:hypothetical protein BGZ83_010676 [Gryganskiella cystojenkinii]